MKIEVEEYWIKGLLDAVEKAEKEKDNSSKQEIAYACLLGYAKSAKYILQSKEIENEMSVKK